MRLRKSEELRREIESDILAGRFRAGERLDEQSLARRFQVSRTPIREAFLQLQSAGLVTYQANRGAFVARLNASDVLEMCELRTELESICGRLAAQRIAPDTMIELARALQACERAVEAHDLQAYFASNDRFHMAVYAMTGNKLLADTAGSLYHRLKFFRHIQFADEDRMQRSLAEHRGIVAAITARDADKAEAALRAHALTRSEKLVEFLVSLSSTDDINNRAVI